MFAALFQRKRDLWAGVVKREHARRQWLDIIVVPLANIPSRSEEGARAEAMSGSALLNRSQICAGAISESASWHRSRIFRRHCLPPPAPLAPAASRRRPCHLLGVALATFGCVSGPAALRRPPTRTWPRGFVLCAETFGHDGGPCGMLRETLRVSMPLLLGGPGDVSVPSFLLRPRREPVCLVVSSRLDGIGDDETPA